MKGEKMQVTRQDLKNLRYLGKEIERLKERIEELEAAVTQTTAKIDGMPKGRNGLNLTVEKLADMRTLLNLKIWELNIQKNNAEKFINDIPDSMTRLVLAKRYIDGYSWRRVAFEVGGGNTEEGVRKMADRVLD